MITTRMLALPAVALVAILAGCNDKQKAAQADLLNENEELTKQLDEGKDKLNAMGEQLARVQQQANDLQSQLEACNQRAGAPAPAEVATVADAKDFQGIEGVEGIGPELHARADFPDLGGLLEHPHATAATHEGECGGQAADTAPGDQDGLVLVSHACTRLPDVKSVSIASPEQRQRLHQRRGRATTETRTR